MNLKNLEKELKEIFNDEEFELSQKKYYFQIIDTFEALLYDISKLNDALADISFAKNYYADLFTNRRKSIDFILTCEDLEYIIERRLKELKISIKQLIFKIYKNKDLYDILIEDFPNYDRVIYKILKENEEEIEQDDEILNAIDFIEDWLDIISYEELDDELLSQLDDEFTEYYEQYLSGKEVSSNDK